MAREQEPIWVESLLTPEEHAECHKKYPSTVIRSKPVQFLEDYHTGGKWRNGMGAVLTAKEIEISNKMMEKLREFITKKLKENEESNISD